MLLIDRTCFLYQKTREKIQFGLSSSIEKLLSDPSGFSLVESILDIPKFCDLATFEIIKVR